MNDLTSLLDRIENLVGMLERQLDDAPESPGWDQYQAFRWFRQQQKSGLVGINNPQSGKLSDLLGIEAQKLTLSQNTEQFLRGQPANNALLWGSRGTGKSSLIKALLTEYAVQGLRLVEVDKHLLIDLPQIVELVRSRPERFIVFCDDLSFERDDNQYKALKVVLDGSLSAPSDNVLIYATSNRRHIVPELMEENLLTHNAGNEIHHADVVEEKISLSERFGLWLSFYPNNQDAYLRIVQHWLNRYGLNEFDDRAQHASLQWSSARASRSGRCAWQFAKDWAGKYSSAAAELD